MKGGIEVITQEHLRNVLEGKEHRKDANKIDCLLVYNMFCNISQGNQRPLWKKEWEYEEPLENDIFLEFTQREFDFLKREEFITTTEVLGGKTRQSDDKYKQYKILEKKEKQLGREYSKLYRQKAEIERGLIVFKRKEKLNDLEGKMLKLSERIEEINKLEPKWLELEKKIYWGNKKTMLVKIEDDSSRAIIKPTKKIKGIFRNVKWITHIEEFKNRIESINYGSKEYQKIIQGFREGEQKDHTPFFENFLQRLNKLSEQTVLQIKPCGIELTELYYDDRCVESPHEIRYIHKPDYKGFEIYEGENNPHLGWDLRYEREYHLYTKITPEKINTKIKKYQKREKLRPDYNPSINEFFENCKLKKLPKKARTEISDIFPELIKRSFLDKS